MSLDLWTPQSLMEDGEYLRREEEKTNAVRALNERNSNQREILRNSVERASSILGMPISAAIKDAESGEGNAPFRVVLSDSQWIALVGRIEAVTGPLSDGSL